MVDCQPQNEQDKEKEQLLKKQKEEHENIKKHHPGMAPVIIERYEKKFVEVAKIENNRYLFENKSPALQAMIRVQEQVKSKRKLWFFVYYKGKPKDVYQVIFPKNIRFYQKKNRLAAKIGTLFRRYRSSDGNLYLYYTDVNLFPGEERTMIILQVIVVTLILIYGYYWASFNEYICRN